MKIPLPLVFLPVALALPEPVANSTTEDFLSQPDAQTSSVIQNQTSLQQDIVSQRTYFYDSFEQRVKKGDRTTDLYSCFSRKDKTGNMVSYNPIAISSLRQKNFYPVNWNLQPIVILDPGHGHGITRRTSGPIDIGASRQGVHEVDVVDGFTAALEKEFKSQGISVVLTRDIDEKATLSRNSFFPEHTTALQIRAELSNHLAKKYPHHPIFFLSLHADVFDEPQRSGSVIYTYGQNGESLSPLSSQMAKTLKGHFSLRPRTSTSHRTEDFAVLRCQPEHVMAALVEFGFLSNPQDRAAMTHPQNVKNIARNFVKGINAFLEKQQNTSEIRIAAASNAPAITLP